MAASLRHAPSAAPLAALLDALPAGSIWQASRIADHADTCHPSGFAALDRELPGGGWPAGALIELLLDQPGVGELSLLLPLLGGAPAERWITLVSPPLLPYAPALADAGVALSRLLLVRPPQARDAVWAARQAAASGSCAAVLAWLHMPDNTALRRLQLAAEAGATPLFLFRPLAAARQSSPAALRLCLTPAAGQLRVDILKRRGPPLARPLLLPIR